MGKGLRASTLVGLAAMLLLWVSLALFFRHAVLFELVAEVGAEQQALISLLQQQKLTKLTSGVRNGAVSSLDADKRLRHPIFLRLRQDIQRLLPARELSTVRIYDADGALLFTSAPDTGLTDLDANNLAPFAQALNGDTVSTVPFKDTLLAFEPQPQSAMLISSYVALLNPAGSMLDTVVVVERDVRQALLAAERILYWVTGGSGAGFLLFYGLFLFCGARKERALLKELNSRISEESRSKHKAHHDALTGLPNRNLLQDRLDQALRQAKRKEHRVVLMLLDLDGFKPVNDTLGHQAGDRLLKVVARRLTECIREGDTVARLGGDEFVLLFPMFDNRYDEPVSAVAQRVLSSIAQPTTLSGQEVKLGCSIGISFYPDDGATADELVKNADEAMYRAKNQGRNNFQFATHRYDIDAVPLANAKTATPRLEHLQLLYQPQLSLKEGDVAGVEAALSWTHPQLGPLAASRFMAQADAAGMLEEVVSWMLQSVCARFELWHQLGISLDYITLDVSYPQFELEALDKMVVAALVKNELLAHYLELKVSGEQLQAQMAAAGQLLPKFRAMGGRVQVSDFVTSCRLGDLQRIAVDRIAIEPAVVGSLPADVKQAAIVRALIALAHKLEIDVVATGVESRAQLAFLKAKACPTVQGDYFSSFQPVDEVTNLMRSWRSKLQQRFG